MVDSSDEQRLNSWIAELGIDAHRRIVRTTPSTTLVSKFEPGFAQALIARLEELPEIFDVDLVRARYLAVAKSSPGRTRVEAWHQASLELVGEVAMRAGLDRREVAEVAAGIDSVAALLDSILFTGPTAGANAPISGAERAAFAEALDRLDSESSLFTRQYGYFEDRLVVNYCPGSRFARLLFEQAWSICSGTS